MTIARDEGTCMAKEDCFLSKTKPDSSLFVFLWAQMQIFMVVPFLGWGVSWHYLVFVVAIETLLFPRRFNCMLLALVSSVRFCFCGAMSNHVFINLFINACILLSWNDGSLRESIRFLLRALYFGTGLHKCNASFIDATVSCASQTTALTFARFGIPSTNEWAILVVKASPGAAILLELALPFLIHTRPGIAIALLFHLSLIFPPMPNSFYPFSMPMLCCFALFVKQEINWAWAAIPVVTTAFYFQVKPSDRLEYPPYNLHQTAEIWIWMTFALLFWSLRRPTIPTMGLREVLVGGRIFPSILLLCASLLPYIGVRVYSGAFAMFSNLRVEGCATNHFILKPVDPFGVMNDLVKVEDTNIPELRMFQVDLARYFLEEEHTYLASMNMSPALWIVPPKWNESIPFTGFTVPRIEMRRVLAKAELEESHYVSYREHAGCADCGSSQQCDQWSDMRRWTRNETITPLQWWEAIFRFRAFDPQNTCRH